MRCCYTPPFSATEKKIIRTLKSCVTWITNDMKWIKILTTSLQKSLTSLSIQNLELQMLLVFSEISVNYISWTSYWLFRSTRVFPSFFNPIYIFFWFFLSYFYFNLLSFFKIFLEGIYLFLCRFLWMSFSIDPKTMLIDEHSLKNCLLQVLNFF